MEPRNVFGNFLRTFDDPVPQQAQSNPPQSPPPPAPVAVPQPAPPTTGAQVPVEALSAIIEAASKAKEPAPAPAPVPAPVIEAPRRKRRRDGGEEQEEDLISRLQRAEQEIEELRLENYRANAVNNARAAGKQFIDALVWGSTPAEIEASLVVAEQEYEQIYKQVRDKVLQETLVQAKAAAIMPAATPQAPEPQLQPPQPVMPQPQPPLSVPEYRAPAQSVQNMSQQEDVLTPDQLKYLTSSEALRNGDYLKNRHLLIHALRRSMPRGPSQEGWNFGQYAPIAPPMPQGQANPYSSVQVPQAQGTPGSYARTAPAMQTLGHPPTPSAAAVVAPVDAAFAQRAAMQAIAATRRNGAA